MLPLDPLLSSPIAERLGWMLVHAVWQGALIALVLAGALHLLRRHAPTVRYAACCAALVLLVVLPVATGLLGAPADPPRSASESQSVASEAPRPAAPSAAGPVHVAPKPPAGGEADADDAEVAWTAALSAQLTAWRDAATRAVRPALPWLVAAWAAGLLVAGGRLLGGAWRLRRVRRRQSSPAPPPWPERMAQVAERLGLQRAVALRVSDAVDGPTLVGWWRPVVLVPAAVLTGLPPAQVEAILAHELAHVRRHDVLVGWLQAVVEALLFFHPAAWWISAQTRRERELCCDDLVTARGADTLTYAEALTAVAEQALAERPSRSPLAMAASDGDLLARIRRLLAPSTDARSVRDRLALGAAALLVLALPVGLAACASQQGATAETTEAERSAKASRAAAPAHVAEETEERRVAVHGDSSDADVRVWTWRMADDSTTRAAVIIDGDTVRVGNRVRAMPRGDEPVIIADGDTIRLGEPFAESIGPSFEALGRNLDVLGRRLESIGPYLDSLGPGLESMGRGLESLEHSFRFYAPDLPGTSEFLDGPDVLDAPHVDFFASSGDTIRVDPEVREQLQRHRRQVDSLRLRHPEWFAWDAEDRERRRQWLDSLRQVQERYADSMRAHVKRLRRQMRAEQFERQSEELREQARRLREQAERLEEQAREMERQRADSLQGTRLRLDSVRALQPSSKIFPTDLIRTIESDASWQQRADALEQLAEQSPAASQPRVQRLLREVALDGGEPDAVRWAALRALGQSDAPAATAVIERMRATDPNDALRQVAAQLLEDE